MSVKQSFILALKSLMTSKMRAFLTMLGIIIGVGSVIVIISLGDGMQARMNEEFESMGSNLLMVSIMGRGGSSRSVKDTQMYEIADKYPEYIAAVSPSVSVNGTVKAGNETYSSTSVTGVSEDYHTIRNLDMAGGRFLQYIDVSKMLPVCVVGAYVDNEIFNGNALGQSIKISGINYTIVGVLDEKSDATQQGGDDDSVYIPYTNAMRINRNATINMYYLSATGDAETDRAKWAVETELYKIFEDDDYYTIISMSEILDMASELTGTLMLVLAAIAGISLLVGGIGIMNIMLVSVTERTKEIGIRKSLGAKRRDIRMQFIIEAGTTSAVGGLIGIALGVTLAGVVGGLIGISAVASVTAITVAFGVSVGVGVLFGYLPANKAAGLNPIDALRYD